MPGDRHGAGERPVLPAQVVGARRRAAQRQRRRVVVARARALRRRRPTVHGRGADPAGAVPARRHGGARRQADRGR
eukprot:610157-Prymnesium_polylepis.1